MNELDTSVDPQVPAKKRLQIFPASEVKDITQTDMRKPSPPPPPERAALEPLFAKGRETGTTTRVLCQVSSEQVPGGLSLVHALFKSHYPLPAHSHDADCVYYILAGSAKVGARTLGPGDSIFVPANLFYSLTPGEDGVEFLEFRTADRYDTVVRSAAPALWERNAATLKDRLAVWETEKYLSERPTSGS